MKAEVFSIFQAVDETIRDAWETCIPWMVDEPASKIPKIVEDFCEAFCDLNKAERKQLEILLRLTFEAYRKGYRDGLRMRLDCPPWKQPTEDEMQHMREQIGDD